MNRTNYTALIGELYDDFEHVSETYLLTVESRWFHAPLDAE